MSSRNSGENPACLRYDTENLASVLARTVKSVQSHLAAQDVSSLFLYYGVEDYVNITKSQLVSTVCSVIEHGSDVMS